MLCCQFLATCLQPLHPSYPIITADPGPRNMKRTLLRCYHAQVESLMGEDGTIADTDAARNEVHAAAVVRSIEARGANRVLGTPAPAIDPEEERLSRKTRRVLSQLRSGFCPSLEDYRHRVGLSESEICPCCRREVHTVQHVFECPDHPTELRPLDLWLRPIGVADFLRTLPFFDLPEEERPPPQNHRLLPHPTTTERNLGYKTNNKQTNVY